MPAIAYFVDNDVVIKFAQYDLLNDLVSALEITHQDIYLLKELAYVASFLDSGKGSEFFGCPDALARAQAFYDVCNIAEISSAEIVRTILSFERTGLDAGELVLLGCLLENQNSQMITGDKRAIPKIDALVSEGRLHFSGARFISLEGAILLLISKLPFEYVSEKIRSRPDADSAITNCFGRTAAVDQNAALDGLSSYISSLDSSISAKLLVEF